MGPQTFTETPTGRLMDLRQCAAYTGLSERRIYELVAKGAIPVTRIDGRLRFDIVAIDKWIRRHTSQPEQAA